MKKIKNAFTLSNMDDVNRTADEHTTETDRLRRENRALVQELAELRKRATDTKGDGVDALFDEALAGVETARKRIVALLDEFSGECAKALSELESIENDVVAARNGLRGVEQTDAADNRGRSRVEAAAGEYGEWEDALRDFKYGETVADDEAQDEDTLSRRRNVAILLTKYRRTEEDNEELKSDN